jgi:hypothetical protein
VKTALLLQTIGGAVVAAGLFILAPWLGVVALGVALAVIGTLLELTTKEKRDGTG